MKKALFIFIFFISFFVSGQRIINTELSPEHKLIRGSKISLVPPKEFTPANNFLGFRDVKSNSSIVVVDIQNSFEKTSRGITSESLFKQGVKVENIEDIIINGLPGKFIKSVQNIYDIEVTKYIMIFGTDSETIMINGIFPKGNFELEKEITKAILSLVYNAEKVITVLDSVDFQISTEGTDFIFAKNMPHMLVYSRDGKIPTESNDKASMVIAKSISKIEISDKKDFSIKKIKGLPMQINTILEINPIEINGLSGYEIIADGIDRKTGEKEQAYQVLLFKNLEYYVLYGASSENFDVNIKTFRKFASTFRLK